MPGVSESRRPPSFERFPAHNVVMPQKPNVLGVGRPGAGRLTEPLSSFTHKCTLEMGMWVRATTRWEISKNKL